MKEAVKRLLDNKKRTVPILSFPATELLGVTVEDLVTSSELQAKGMAANYERGLMGALVTPMDLSVEAECFGAEIRMDENDVPTVEKPLIDDIMDAADVEVPEIMSGRSGVFIEGTRLAKEVIKDTPVFCGAIGPYSLAGRLFDMTELMMECFDSPDEVKILLSKTTEFIIKYIKAHKEAGAQGVILAEPAAGLLSPSLCGEFSCDYVKQIVDAVSDENFVFCYHNCGGSVPACIDEIKEINADVYHFGNAVDISKVIDKLPKDSVVMGNIDPLIFRDGTKEDIIREVDRVFDLYGNYENFMISSGCDIPATSKWENIDAYFARVAEKY